MRILRTFFPMFLTVSSPQKLTELKSSMTPLLPKILKKYDCSRGLDVNCWTGDSTIKLQSQFPDIRIFGIDKNQSAIKLAKTRFHSSVFKVSDIEKENLSGKFELIQISNYTNLDKVLWNTYPLLSDNGFMIVNYKESDVPYMKELYDKNFRFPPQERNGYVLSNMYLFEKENKAIILK